MTGGGTAARAGAMAAARKDPAVAATALALWLLLALFVVYPLAMLLARTLTDHGSFTMAGIATILTGFALQSIQYWVALLDVKVR